MKKQPARRPWSWTPFQEEKPDQVMSVVNELRSYWPLTLRQIYYQLVSRGQIENKRSDYNMLSKLIKWMRIDERLSWEAIEDRTRVVTSKRGFENLEDFVESEMDNFLEGYTRCLVQGQSKYVEVWTEKDALFRIFEEVVWPYCIRAVVCRGYNSVTFIADFYTRAEMAIMKGQQPVVLYFGDLDPSGVQMLEATIQTLEDELGLCGVQFKRVGLNPEHMHLYNLPHDPMAAKITDPRYRSYVQEYGNVAVELDALHPQQLKEMIGEATKAELDMELFEGEKEQEWKEQDRLWDIRQRVMGAVQEVMFD